MNTDKNKGSSTVLAFVLLILLVVSISGGILTWVRITSDETREGIEEMASSDDISFYIENIEQDGNTITLEITNNGKFPIPSDEIVVFYEGELGSDVEQIEGEDPIPPGESGSFEVEINS